NRDPALAQELIESVVKEPPGPGPKPGSGPNGTVDQRANHYMFLATDLLSTDPARAIEVAKTGLTEGAGNINVFPQFVSLLQSLGQKDTAAADGLFNYALSVVQHDPAHFDASIRWLSTYVFPDTAVSLVCFSARARRLRHHGKQARRSSRLFS